MSIDVFEQLFSIHWGHGCFDFVGEGERRSLGLVMSKDCRRDQSQGVVIVVVVVMEVVVVVVGVVAVDAGPRCSR